MTRPGVAASRLKLWCLVVVVVGSVATAVGGGTDLSVMLALVGVGLFVGLALVPMGSLSASVGVPRSFAALLIAQAAAIDVFVLLQPVDGPLDSGSRVGVLGLLGHRAVSDTGACQVIAVVGLAVAVGCALAAFVALRRLVGRPGWRRPPAEPIGFYDEGRDRRG